MSAALELATPSANGAVEYSLNRAFACFTEAAESLERSYHQLESEVVRLRQELKDRNADLERSVEHSRQVRDSLYRILEGLPCGVLVGSDDGGLSLVNPAASRLLGGVRPTRFSEIPAVLVALLQHVRRQEGEWEMELTSPGGELVAVTARRAWLGQPGRKAVFIVDDVSERKRLLRDRERLERQRALADMAAVLAHEIRNPLGSLELFAGLLADSDLGAEAHEWVDQVQAGLRMLAATVNNVLHFHNLPPPQLAPTDIGQLLDWVCDFLSPLARQSAVQLRLDNQLGGVHISVDAHRLEQVLLNLTINAFRFVSAGGTVTIAARVLVSEAPGMIRIEVADTGPGIAPEQLSRIFDPGFTTRAGSPGLGLTVCKTIVEQHGGTIRAANLSAGGASFQLTLPLGDA